MAKITELSIALSRLPKQTPVGVSIFGWIAAHPALKRFDPATAQRVEITAEDVLYAPHGRAPSLEAVAALERFANAPADFWKKWLEVQAKNESKSAGESQEGDDAGVVDVEKMLKEVRSRRKK